MEQVLTTYNKSLSIQLHGQLYQYSCPLCDMIKDMKLNLWPSSRFELTHLQSEARYSYIFFNHDIHDSPVNKDLKQYFNFIF